MASTGIARLFTNGRSQAVRLPREFRFAGDRVRVRRAGRGVLLEPLVTSPLEWFAELDIAVSPVSLFELWYGVAKSARPEVNTQRLEAFLAGPLEVSSFDEEAARAAGRVRAALEVRGKPIGAYHLLLAGQALASGARLVTANVAEFSRVPGLAWEDWASAKR